MYNRQRKIMTQSDILISQQSLFLVFIAARHVTLISLNVKCEKIQK